MNKRYWMLVGWLLITLVLSGVAVMPTVWAEPLRPQQDNWTVPTRTPTPGPPTEPPPTQEPTEPPATQPPVDSPTVTPPSEEPTTTATPESSAPTVTPTPSGTQTATETPVTEAVASTATPATDKTSPTTVSVEVTPTLEVAANGTPSEASSDSTDLPPTSEPASPQGGVDTAAGTEGQSAEVGGAVEAPPVQSVSGGGSWLFFGGVGLLLVGVILLLVWRRQG